MVRKKTVELADCGQYRRPDWLAENEHKPKENR